MIEIVRRNPLIAALGAACIALAVVVAVELATLGGSASPAATRKAAPAESKLLPPLAVVTPDQVYPETVNRPLWIPTRRPAPPVVAAAASFVRGQFILQGVTIAGDTRIAMLKEKSSGRIFRVEKGRDVNGLQVADVEPEKVTLAQGAEREIVELRVQRPGGPAGPGVPGAPPPPPLAASGGPFAPSGLPPAPPGAMPLTPGVPGVAQAVPMAPQGGTGGSVGPLAPTRVPGGIAQPIANPSAAAVPQPQSATPMTPEELLARRRARRTQTP